MSNEKATCATQNIFTCNDKKMGEKWGGNEKETEKVRETKMTSPDQSPRINDEKKQKNNSKQKSRG